MKNTKLIALVAVLVVITLVVSIVVATSNDKKVSDDLKQTVTDYESKIDALNKTIDELNKGIISAEEALEALKNAGVELKEWNEATVALPQMLVDLKNAAIAFHNNAVVINPEYKGEITKVNGLVNGGFVLADFNALYNYTVDGASVKAQFTAIYNEAQNDLFRATSVEEMKNIVKGLTASYDAIPTSIEALRTAITEAEKNGVTYDDYANIKLARYLVKEFVVDADLYAKDEQEDLAKRLVALYKDFAPVVVASFQTLAEALPEVEMVAPSHYAQVEEATDELAFVAEIYTELYGAEASAKFQALLTKKNGKLTDLGKAVDKYQDVVARVAVVKQIEAHANQVNDRLAKAFTKDNMEGWVLTNYGANLATHNYIYNTLWAHIDYWERINEIVTDEKDEDYNEELHNLVNYDVYEGYIADFEVVVEELRTAADAFIESVEAIEAITPDSLETLNASKALFDAAAKLMKKEDLDIILDYVDYVDEDGEDVEINGVVDSWYTMWALYDDYFWLVDAIAALENDVKDSIIKCTDNTHGTKDQHGDIIPCTCANVGKYDYSTIGNHDGNIVIILGNYGLDESVFDTALLDVYKVARLQSAIATAKTNVATAHGLATADSKDSMKRVLEAEIDRISLVYTFAVELVCTCPDDSTDPCECNTYKMAIVNDPAKTLADNYTVDYLLNNRFDVK